ncbi:hypothetical protein JS86_24705 [Vibrio vulnificus]|nr:hypothetical protein JS86_24705 [Vibrio vulnificus]
MLWIRAWLFLAGGVFRAKTQIGREHRRNPRPDPNPMSAFCFEKKKKKPNDLPQKKKKKKNFALKKKTHLKKIIQSLFKQPQKNKKKMLIKIAD